MDVKKKAYEFAIMAHNGQYRKAELEKPAVFHAIDVAKKLEKFGFDDNVVAAGYLHDVIEDTKYTKDDILKNFGEDVTSLVLGATEEDRTLSWEERKLGTINRVRTLDLRHKAVVVCDKISNIEDLIYKFGKDGYEDFSSFNRGKDKKIWYWNEVYKSLVANQDENLLMFMILKVNLDKISNIKNIINNEYYPDINVISQSLSESFIAQTLHYQKNEIFKIMSLFDNKDSYVIEFVGKSKIKRKIMSKIKTYFMLSGFRILIIDNFHFFNNNTYELINNYDLILLDNAFLNKIINMCMHNKQDIIHYRELSNYINNKKKVMKNKIDMFVAINTKNNKLYNNSLNSCIRRYIGNQTIVYQNYNDEISENDLLNIINLIIENMRTKFIDDAKNNYLIRKKVKKQKNNT